MTGRACPECGTIYLPPVQFCPKHGKRLEEPGAPRASASLGANTMQAQVVDGRYRLERRIGEGGMAQVYLANDLERKKAVAIKVLLPRVAIVPGAVERLQREAAIARRLDHPNVCRVLDFGWTADKLFYLVLPFVEGETLGALMTRTGPMAASDAVRRLGDVCSGLDYAHTMGVVHRDMKPDNVMIMPQAGDRAVVMDFGLAKEAQAQPNGARLTATGMVVGTPAYMSPEQLSGGDVDGRTDQYSVGLMAYEMLVGRLPFTGVTPEALLVARLRDTPEPLRSLRPELPAALEAALLRALAFEPGDRFPTMREFARELAAAL